MKKVQLTEELKFRAPASMVEQIQAIADAEPAGINRSDVMREAIREYIERHRVRLAEDPPPGKTPAPRTDVAGPTAPTSVKYSSRRTTETKP